MIETQTVTALVRRVKDLVESDLILRDLWVEGEISNLSKSSRGHLYFTLKDPGAQLACVLFQRQYRGTPLDHGARVLAHGSVTVYEERGTLQLIVDFIQPAGVGASRAEFERIKEKLAAEGLFAEERKRPLPPFPQRIGVVTSPTGAVFHDIQRVLERRWPLAEIVLAPTPVQGPEAAVTIAEAIRLLNREPGIDVMIVARGGGSAEELWPFNEEIVARAIFGSSVPVVSAVGHETDVTIADFVADRRAPTPSAAAEVVAPDASGVSHRVEAALRSGLFSLQRNVREYEASVERALHRLNAAIPDTGRLAERIASLMRHAGSTAARSLELRTERVIACSLQLRSLDPHATLERGYAVVQLRDGKQAITSVSQVKGNEQLDIHVRDGKFPAQVSRQYGF